VPLGVLPGFIFWLDVSLCEGVFGVVSIPDVPVLAPFPAAALEPDFVGAALLSDGIFELSRPCAFVPGRFDDPLSAAKAAGETARMMADARMAILIAFPFLFSRLGNESGLARFPIHIERNSASR